LKGTTSHPVSAGWTASPFRWDESLGDRVTRERVGGDVEWHDITHLFCRVNGFAFLPSRPPARRACASAVLRSAASMECNFGG
jgi:hypothetical protein